MKAIKKDKTIVYLNKEVSLNRVILEEKDSCAQIQKFEIKAFLLFLLTFYKNIETIQQLYLETFQLTCNKNKIGNNMIKSNFPHK